MSFKNIDTSSLTPEELAQAEAMADYTKTHECKNSFRVISLAESFAGHLLESDSRPSPVELFTLALKYAEHANVQGEQYMQADFRKWLATRQAPAPEPDDVDDLDTEPANVEIEEFEGATELKQLLQDAGPDPENTITRDEAIADTERRVKENSKPTPAELDAGAELAMRGR